MLYKKKGSAITATEDDGSVASLLKLDEEVTLSNIFDKMKTGSKERKFSEAVEIILKLNVDPTKGNQNVRGTCIMPAGIGKEVRVAVFADMEFHGAV